MRGDCSGYTAIKTGKRRGSFEYLSRIAAANVSSDAIIAQALSLIDDY